MKKKCIKRCIYGRCCSIEGKTVSIWKNYVIKRNKMKGIKYVSTMKSVLIEIVTLENCLSRTGCVDGTANHEGMFQFSFHCC